MGLERWRMGWTMAWKRPVQLLATMAETWMAVWAWMVLVAVGLPV
jgi:hypothetical protein